MLLPSVTILAWVLLFLPHPSIQSCISGTRERCNRAAIAPGSTLAGEGFDITTMKRKTAFVIDMRTYQTKNGTCTLCSNSYQSGQMQKIPISVVSWRPHHECSVAVKGELLESALSVAEYVSNSVQNNWGTGLGLSKFKFGDALSLSGSHARMTTTAMKKSKQDRFRFVTHSVHCGFYSYMVSSNPNLSPDFQKVLEKLPRIYTPSNTESFDSLIDTYGTHFIKKVQTGGKILSMTSIRECKASLMGLNADEVKMCLGAEASAKIPYKVDIDVNAEITFCNGKKEKTMGRRSFSNIFRDRITVITGGQTTEGEILFSADRHASAYNKWLASLPVNPDVISYTVKPLHLLVPNKQVKRALKKAIVYYIKSRALRRQCSNQCKLGRRTKHGSCACHCQNHKGLGSNCCPTRPGLAKIVLNIVRGKGLFGDYSSGTDGYVKVFDKNNILLGKTHTINNNNNPSWNQEFDMDDMLLSANSKLKIEVWDADNYYDDLLGTCYAPLRSGNRGEVVCPLNHGQLFYKLRVTCGPNLRGPFCADYARSPMSSLWERLYVSRHARPIPKHMLFQTGMRQDKQAFNYTFKG